jgi:ABC-2 type transport system permease protein
MTHFMRIVRGIILRDASFAGLAADLLYLAGFFVVTLTIAIFRFRKRLD